MQSQLVEQYLGTAHCRSGIYLIAWFDQGRWDPNDYRRNDVPKLEIDAAKKFFAQQAMEQSKDDRVVRSFVLDCNF